MAFTPKQKSGLFYAIFGIFLFSLSLPFTKLALESFDPLFTAFARPIIASTLAIPLMLKAKVPALPRNLWRPMAFTTLGGVFGWPILISLALQRTTTAHVAVVSAVMPLATAIMSVLKNKKKVGMGFWAASGLGTLLLVVFSIGRGGEQNLISLLIYLFSAQFLLLRIAMLRALHLQALCQVGK